MCASLSLVAYPAFADLECRARKLYNDTAAARRHILGPDRTGSEEPLTPEASSRDRRVSPLTPQEEGYVRRVGYERYTPSPVQPEPPLFSPRPLNIRSPPTTSAPTSQAEQNVDPIRDQDLPEAEGANITPPTPEDPFRPHSNPFDLSLRDEPSIAYVLKKPSSPCPRFWSSLTRCFSPQV